MAEVTENKWSGILARARSAVSTRLSLTQRLTAARPTVNNGSRIVPRPAKLTHSAAALNI